MSNFEIVVTALLIVNAVLGILVLVRLAGRTPVSDLATSIERLGERFADTQTTLQSGFTGMREETASGSKLAREEISARIDGLAASITATLAAIGKAQNERLEGFGAALADNRTATEGHAKAVREELVGSFEKLSTGMAGRLNDQAADQTRRFDSFAAQNAEHRKGTGDDAKALREELVGNFDKLSQGLSGRMTDQVAEQTRRLDGFATQLGEHRAASGEDAKLLRGEVSLTLATLGARLTDGLELASKRQGEGLTSMTETLKAMTEANEKRQDALRQTVEGRLDTIRTENSAKLEEMRVTVDEKLQGTLEARLGASFSQVNENLERVFKSVGEMQAIATGVGDLKRVLSNVKSRGTWGETTLGLLLEQVMTPEQYAQNVEVQPNSGQRVEYAIRLPGEGDQPLWLPIDAKLPTGDYERLAEAAERGDAVAVEEAAKGIEKAIRLAAKDISTKYVHPPHSTDFGVMFLPTEGLFAEVVRRPGLLDTLQRECRVIVTGPTTLMALLTSLRMGFRSLAIQKRSSEVWQVLGAVKSEFGKFGEVLDKVQKKLGEAQNVVELAGRRKRAVDKKLKSVEALPEAEAQALLAVATDELLEGFDEIEAAE